MMIVSNHLQAATPQLSRQPIFRAGRSGRLLWHLLVLLLCASSPLRAADDLPSPLTLQQALSFAAEHPRVLAAAEASATALFPRRQPLFLGCHELAFTGSRGRDDVRDAAWSALLAPASAQRLAIMQRFFDVLLADLSYSRDSEALAVAYIQFDRARVRAELGQFSPLKVAELEAGYQLILRQRAASEASQRITRSLLAQALGRADQLPRDLITPDLTLPDSKPPALELVVTAALRDNPQVQRLIIGASPARRALLEMEVRQQALELLTRLELLDVIAEQARVESNWRDLKLDESRTLYELEAQADLGFSMSQQTKARRDEEQVALCQALTHAELQALQGQ